MFVLLESSLPFAFALSVLLSFRIMSFKSFLSNRHGKGCVCVCMRLLHAGTVKKPRAKYENHNLIDEIQRHDLKNIER